MLTRIRNSNRARISQLSVINTNLTFRILEILKDEGFIDSFGIDKSSKNCLLVNLKYKGVKQIPYISNLSRVSRPGFRVYVSKNKIPRVFGGLGVAI